MAVMENAVLNEKQVKKFVENWVKSEHPNWSIWSRWHFDIITGPSQSEPLIAVECKGASSKRYKMQRAIGQCLDYMAGTRFAQISCFIATPKDFWFNKIILQILEQFELPIGLLIVNDHGTVTVSREAKRSHVKE